MKNYTKPSRFISLVLRHKPEEANLTLDSEGYASVRDLLKGMAHKKYALTLKELQELVAEDEKGRYSFSSDGKKIRANQGHSAQIVNITFEVVVPPDWLYHGTNQNAVGGIFKDGIKKMERHHVHLTENKETAKKVGGRRGEWAIFYVNAKKMHEDGIIFKRSENNVWLVEFVDRKYFGGDNYPTHVIGCG